MYYLISSSSSNPEAVVAKRVLVVYDSTPELEPELAIGLCVLKTFGGAGDKGAEEKLYLLGWLTCKCDFTLHCKI